MRNLQIISAIFAIFTLLSCDDNSEPEKLTPSIEFFVDHELIGVNWEVKLTNISDRTPIKYFEWDFGDGSNPETILPKSNSSDIPQHFYYTPGEYNIKLTGVQEDGTRISNEQKIRVGKAFIDKVEIHRISEYRNTDTSKKWDSESEGVDVFPDVRLCIKEKGELVYESQIYSNLERQHLPLVIGIPSIELKLSESGMGIWGDQQQFYLYDIDGEEEELMIAPEICTILWQRSLEQNYELHSGKFEVSCGDYLLHFHYALN